MAPSLQGAMSRLPPGIGERAGALVHRHDRLRRVLNASLLRRVQFADVAISQGPAEGLRFNASGGPSRYVLGTIEPEVQALMAGLLAPGDVLYDLGASIGFFSVLGAHLVGPTGHVVAVEPLPPTVERLRHNVELNGFANVAIRQAACAEAPGSGRFVGGEQMVWGWLDPDGVGDGIDVPVVTVDQLVAEGAPPPSLIKLDIEGAETRALRGAQETLRRVRPIVVCETHGTRDEVRELLEAHDYAVTGLDGSPLATGTPEPLAEGWFDHALARPR